MEWRVQNRGKSGRELMEYDADDGDDREIRDAECKSVWELQCTGLITC